MGINSFRRKTVDGVITYFYNGAEVSKEEFEKQRAAAKQKQTELLGGVTIEEKRRQIQKKFKKYKGGLMVKPKAAKRGY
jgi:hypothetical protein